MGDLLRGRELVGDGPARLAPDDAKVLLIVEAVHLDYDAVAAVVELFGVLHPTAVVFDSLFYGVYEPVVGVDLEAHGPQPGEGIPVRLRGGAAGVAQPVYEDVQRPFSRLPGVELAHRACGGIPRVRIGR